MKKLLAVVVGLAAGAFVFSKVRSSRQDATCGTRPPPADRGPTAPAGRVPSCRDPGT